MSTNASTLDGHAWNIFTMDDYDNCPPHVRKILAYCTVNASIKEENMSMTTAQLKKNAMIYARAMALSSYGSNYPIEVVTEKSIFGDNLK